MPLSCECDFDQEPGMTVWYDPDNYEPLATTRRKRCSSCNHLINIGDLCSISLRFKVPEYEIEVAIYGEDGEIERAHGYMCEPCADIYFSLKELGFCVGPWENQRENLQEYHDVYGPVKTV